MEESEKRFFMKFSSGLLIFFCIFVLLVVLIFTNKDITLIDKTLVVLSYVVLAVLKDKIPEEIEKQLKLPSEDSSNE